MIEKILEHNQTLYFESADYQKAFDSLEHDWSKQALTDEKINP